MKGAFTFALLALQMLQSVSNDVRHAGGAPSSFAYVASSVTGCINTQVSQTACQTTLHQTPGSGHLLLMFVVWSGNTLTVAVTGTQTWIAIGAPTSGTGTLSAFRQQMFYVPSATASATTVTATISSGTTSLIFWEAAEYSYTGTISGPDGTPQYLNTSAVASVATIDTLTTSNASDLIWSVCAAVDHNCTGDAGYTTRDDLLACNASNSVGGCSSTLQFNNALGSLIEEKVNVAAATQTATFGTPGGATDNTMLGLVAF